MTPLLSTNKVKAPSAVSGLPPEPAQYPALALLFEAALYQEQQG